MPELWTARENARLEIGSQRGRNSHQIGVLGIYDLRGLSYGRNVTSSARSQWHPPCGEVPLNGHIRTASAWKLRVNYKLSPLAPQPSSMGHGAVRWALGAILCWSPGARFNGTPRR